MVMTMLEAQVVPERWATLRESYNARVRLPAGAPVIESFLVQSADAPDTWRIVTIWRDRETLDALRASGETPTGVLIFRDAGADARLTIFDVRANPRQAPDPTP